jgi:hypothetical protein
MRDVIGRQPWISVYSITERGTDIILSLHIQQECIPSLTIVEKIAYISKTTDSNATNISTPGVIIETNILQKQKNNK